MIVAEARDHPSSAWHDRSGERDQTAHVVVDAGEIFARYNQPRFGNPDAGVVTWMP